MEQYISQVQFFEGFVGAFAAFGSYHILKSKLKSKKNNDVVAALTFLISWIFRKVFVNVYLNLKKQNISSHSFYRVYNLYTFFFIFLTSLMTYFIATKKIQLWYITIYVLFVLSFINLVCNSVE